MIENNIKLDNVIYDNEIRPWAESSQFSGSCCYRSKHSFVMDDPLKLEGRGEGGMSSIPM